MIVNKAAEILELHPKTVRRMLRDGRLKGMVIPAAYPGGKCVYRLDDDYVYKMKAGVEHKLPPKLNLEALNG